MVGVLPSMVGVLPSTVGVLPGMVGVLPSVVEVVLTLAPPPSLSQTKPDGVPFIEGGVKTAVQKFPPGVKTVRALLSPRTPRRALGHRPSQSHLYLSIAPPERRPCRVHASSQWTNHS